MPRAVQVIMTVLLLTMPSALAGCRQQQTPVVVHEEKRFPPQYGFFCTVYFRRDALGTEGAAPIPIESTNFNGATIGLSGKIVTMDKDWLILENITDDSRQWIPRSVILYLDVRPKP